MMYTAKITVDKVNSSAVSKDWHHLCRLCAKEDAQNVNVFFKDENESSATGSAVKTEERLLIGIQKYFNVNFKRVGLPHRLCPECFSLVISLDNFTKRVVKVQEMFDALHNFCHTSEVDIQALRLKYGILEDDRPHSTIPMSLIGTNLFEATLDKNDHKVKNSPQTADTEMPDEPHIAIEIKLENVVDVTPATDEDVCDFENEDVEDEDPFGSEIEVKSCSDRPNEKKTQQGKISSKSRKENPKRKKKIKPNTEKFDRNSASESTEYKYYCSECPQRFQRVGSYRVHLNKKHGITDMPSFSCAKCSRSFKNAFNLKRHIETHRPPSEKKIFPCPQCDRKFQTKDYVATHIKFVHEDIRPLICEECGEGVRTQGALREHMLTHTDYAPFECEVCNKSFKNQTRLKNHMEIHSSDKHICSECGLQLNSRVTLNRHMLVHSDVMQHKCDYCGRAFKRAKTLKSHLILHSGIKPYSCEFCDRTFTSGSNCRTHMKRAHPSELAELEASGEKKYTKNIPKLAVLKSVMKKAENLIPVVPKQSGNFAIRRKPGPQLDVSNCTKNIAHPEPVAY